MSCIACLQVCVTQTKTLWWCRFWQGALHSHWWNRGLCILFSKWSAFFCEVDSLITAYDRKHYFCSCNNSIIKIRKKYSIEKKAFFKFGIFVEIACSFIFTRSRVVFWSYFIWPSGSAKYEVSLRMQLYLLGWCFE